MDLHQLMKHELAPSMDAVVMASGELFVLEYQLLGDYRSVGFLCQSSLVSYLAFQGEESLSAFDMTCQAENDRYLVYGGESSYGSVGVLALFDKLEKTYVWLMNLEYSNPFEKLELDGEWIIAHNNNQESWKFLLEWPIEREEQ